MVEKLRKIYLLAFSLAFLTFGQSPFSTQAYKAFLQQHQDLSSSSFYQLYDAGLFRNSLNRSLSGVRFLDTTTTQYALTSPELNLLQRNGFMVSQRLMQQSFGQSYLDVFNKDLPLFISTDAILHAWHFSYDRMLKSFEIGFLSPQVKSILDLMAAQMPTLAARYADKPEMKRKINDVDVYLTVPRQLFTAGAAPYNADNKKEIDNLITLINSYQLGQVNLFADNCKLIDFSQFKPRSHYVDSYNSDLANYFKVMMWLGRIEIMLLAPHSVPFGCPAQSYADIQRQTIDAFLLQELIDLAQVRSKIQEVEDFLKFFVGEQDNVTCDNLSYLKNAVGLEGASALLDSLTLKTFQDTLAMQAFCNQRILSQILFSDPLMPDSIVPASSFLLFGQRFVIDSYVTGSVVYDRIKFQGQQMLRMLPSSLDVLFSMGNDAAGQLLQGEVDQYHYAGNLAALRYLISSYDTSFWQSSLYNYWLQSIRTLNPPAQRSTLPMFMQTAAFWQEKMNTQLASWAQLRHDNLLYAKQSYSGGTTCSYPYVYVEPFPELYRNLKNTAIKASQKLQSFTFTNAYLKEMLTWYFTTLETISATLESVTTKELAGTELTDEEKLFLQSIIYKNPEMGCAPPYSGWYPQLFFNDPGGRDGFMAEEFIVADYHTAPTNEAGVMVGWVKHAGTGPIDMGVFIAPVPGVGDVAFTGPVMSYQEYTSTNFQRLTDQEWAATYRFAAPRPSFVNIYLADTLGNSRGEGLKLFTDVERESVQPQKDFRISVTNYPNPFNSTTILHFTVPADAANQNVELTVFDINGSQVDRLIQEPIPSGNYTVRWSPKDRSGKELASGIYFCRVKAGALQAQHKLVYLK